MLNDEDFSRNAAVDRYGRKLAKDDTKKQLKKFYRLDEEEDEDQDEDDVSIDDDDEVRKELKRVEERSHDPARDGGFSDSSSDEESSSEEEDEEAEKDDDELEFPDKQQSNVPPWRCHKSYRGRQLGLGQHSCGGPNGSFLELLACWGPRLECCGLS